jgi:hypothetical protein
MNDINPDPGNYTDLPGEALPSMADMHVMSLHLVGLTGALDEIYQGGSGNKGQIAAVIEAAADKSLQLARALEANYEAGVGA